MIIIMLYEQNLFNDEKAHVFARKVHTSRSIIQFVWGRCKHLR